MPITFPTADTGRQIKFPVRVASTANVTIQPGGTTLTIDGVALANNDRVLLKDQTTASQNGIYYVGGIGTSVTLNRSPDLSYVADFPALTEVPVALGTINGGTVWAMSSAAPATLGTSAIYFTRTYPSYEPATWRNPWLPATTAAQIVAATPLQENMSRLLIGSAAITPTTTVMTWAGGMVLPAGKTVSGVVLYAIAAGTLTAAMA